MQSNWENIFQDEKWMLKINVRDFMLVIIKCKQKQNKTKTSLSLAARDSWDQFFVNLEAR